MLAPINKPPLSIVHTSSTHHPTTWNTANNFQEGDSDSASLGTKLDQVGGTMKGTNLGTNLGSIQGTKEGTGLGQTLGSTKGRTLGRLLGSSLG